MSGDQALVGYVAFMLIVLIPVSIFIVFFYAEPGFPWHSYITLIIGFYAAFGIMLMIPIDMAVIIHDRSSTDTTAGSGDAQYAYDVGTLSDVYNTFFTMVLILGSVVLVFEEYYNTDGFFTVNSKLWSSFKRMCFDLFVPAIVGGIILAILIGENVVSSNADALKLTMVVLTNTIYETFLMFLLGYSLVEFPRWIWGQGDLDKYLLRVQTKASQQFKDISEAQLSVSLAVSDVLKTRSAVQSGGDQELKNAMAVLVADCPEEFKSDRLGKVAQDKSGKITINSLAQLRTRLNILKDNFKMAQAKVEGTKVLAYTLEDIIAARNNPAATVIHWSLSDKDSTRGEYRWHIFVRPVLLKIAAVICAGLSILSFLGVVCSMTGVSNGVSPYFLAVHGQGISPTGICIFVFVTFAYTVNITTWAIFEMKLGAAYELVPGRTTPEALSFNVRMVARLAAPLAFFYLGWIAENGIKTGSWTNNNGASGFTLTNVTTTNSTTGLPVTVLVNSSYSAISMPSAFSNFYQLQAIGTVQEVFGTIFPIILYVVLGLCALNFFNRLLIFFKLENYQFGAQIITDEQLREGKRQLERYKGTTVRAFRRGELKSRLVSMTNRASESSSEGGGAKPGFSLMALFTPQKKREILREESLFREDSSRPAARQEPAALNGTLDKKSAFSLTGGGGWKEIYGEVRSPGFLHLHKDKKTADQYRYQPGAATSDPSSSADPAATVVDLRAVLDFKEFPASGRGGGPEMEIELPGESLRFRFKSAAELERWKNGLRDWKDFLLDSGGLGGSAAGGGRGRDVETGSSAGLMDGRSSAAASSKKSGLSNDLDSIHIEEEDEDERGVRPLMKGKAASPMKPSGGGAAAAVAKPSAAPAPAHHEDEKPPALEGWLEKKEGGRLGSSDWQKRYVRVSESTDGALLYFKTSAPKADRAGAIDLKLVKDITFYEKGGKPDFSRFNLDSGDGKVHKFRATNEAEGQRWIDGLNAWRDYFLMNMS